MPQIAYFSAEIGFSSSIPTYSGGLGVLAGDHLKAAADANMPLVGITLLYRHGYFRQHVGHDGWQTESYPIFNPQPALEKLSNIVEVTLQGRKIKIAIWRTHLTGYTGHKVPILFLDADVPGNAANDRALTHSLYGGDTEHRLWQEAVLGFAGTLAVHDVYSDIKSYHLNEGHCSFVPLALLKSGFDTDHVRKRTHFTTHTPVPAGHDVFPYHMAERVLGDLLPPQIRTYAGQEALSMSELALNLCGSANGVSELHGHVSRDMFPDKTIGYVTNGVHHLTWVSPHMAALFDRDLPGWRHDPSILVRARDLQPDAVAAARAACKKALLDYANSECNLGYAEDILTIGFARRAASYKRATLLFRDPARLTRICAGKVQFVFAGKAHPRDDAGHRLIQGIVQAGQQLGEQLRIGYINNYNMLSGALITAGVDVWLNTPLRPHEASGTSGMKAALNGVPSASIADGWWAEGAQDGSNGWIIGDSAHPNDEADADSLYNVLEQHIIPTYYQNQARWRTIVQEAISTGTQFTAARMVHDYRTQYYSRML